MNIKDCKVSAETMAHISKAIFAGLKNVKIEYVKFNSKYNNGLGLSILNNIFEEIDILSTSIIVKSYQRGSYIFPIIYDVNTKTIITLASINVLDRLLHRKEIINPHYIDALLMENHELEGNYQQESMFDDDYVDEIKKGELNNSIMQMFEGEITNYAVVEYGIMSKSFHAFSLKVKYFSETMNLLDTVDYSHLLKVDYDDINEPTAENVEQTSNTAKLDIKIKKKELRKHG